MAKTRKSAAKPSARKKRTLTVKKETIKDLAAPGRGRDVKGGTLYYYYSTVKSGGLGTVSVSSRLVSSGILSSGYSLSG